MPDENTKDSESCWVDGIRFLVYTRRLRSLFGPMWGAGGPRGVLY